MEVLNHYFDHQFQLRYFEMNELGMASPATILTLLEEAAAEHCYSIDHSLYQLADRDIGWVLISGVLQMDRYPRYKERITIRTWLSSYSRIKGHRENLIYDERGGIIGRARGLWIFFDINRRRPVQIPDDIMERWALCEVESMDHDIGIKIEGIEKADYQRTFRINKYDTDMIKHVNNIRYLQWAIESIPDEIIDQYYLHTIDGRFIAEAYYGQSLVSRTKALATTSGDHSFVHSISIEGSGKICATAKTVWRKAV
jgi:medium-chain acyl-[acyl-carrier-protein] hydrolase